MLPLLTGILVACLVATTPLLAAANEVVGWNETTVKAIEAMVRAMSWRRAGSRWCRGRCTTR
jgi:hypothetical protein